MKYTVYNNTTGEIKEILTISNAEMVPVILNDAVYVEGYYDPERYYIDQSQPVEKPARPMDGHSYDFNWTTKTWDLNVEHTANQVRQIRDRELGNVDRVNPIRYSLLTSQQQTELATYRQALLDVPQQSGFPTAVDWPVKPSWL